VDQAVEAGLDETITTTVVPLMTFMGAVGDLLTAPPVARVPAGVFACPNTSNWCASGSVVCAVAGQGLNFDFNGCLVAGGDEPLTLTGDVTAVPGTPILLTLNNLFINDSPAMTGTGSIDTAACDYTVNVHTSDATIAGTITSCDEDPYPTGDTITVGFSDFLVQVFFDGTHIAHAGALRNGTPVASCTIDLDVEPFTSSCDAL
jgi:hypothetical protein